MTTPRSSTRTGPAPYELVFDESAAVWSLLVHLPDGDVLETVGRQILGTGPEEGRTAQQWATAELIDDGGQQTIVWEPAPAAGQPWRYVGRRSDAA